MFLVGRDCDHQSSWAPTGLDPTDGVRDGNHLGEVSNSPNTRQASSLHSSGYAVRNKEW